MRAKRGIAQVSMVVPSLHHAHSQHPRSLHIVRMPLPFGRSEPFIYAVAARRCPAFLHRILKVFKSGFLVLGGLPSVVLLPGRGGVRADRFADTATYTLIVYAIPLSPGAFGQISCCRIFLAEPLSGGGRGTPTN